MNLKEAAPTGNIGNTCHEPTNIKLESYKLDNKEVYTISQMTQQNEVNC